MSTGKQKEKAKSSTKKSAPRKSGKAKSVSQKSPRAPSRRLDSNLADRVLDSVADKDIFIEQKVQEIMLSSTTTRQDAEQIAKDELKQLVISKITGKSKKTEALVSKVEQFLSDKIKTLELHNSKKSHENLQAGVSPENQVSKAMVIAYEQPSMAGPGGPVYNESTLMAPLPPSPRPPTLKRSSSQPSMSSTQVLALKPPLTVGDSSTVAPSSFLAPPVVQNVTHNDNSSTNYDNTVNNITNVTQAQSNIKTSQGGGGQHAVMPHHVDEETKFGVNMISQALRRTVGGGGGPPIFSDGGNGNGPNVPPLPEPYKVPKPPKKRTKGYDLIGNALDRILDPSIHSVISSQQPNAYRSERVKDPSVVGQVPKRMEMLDDALWKQPIDPSNATEYSWFKMNDSYCEPAKLGTISAFEKYNADPGIVNLTGMLGNPNGITMDDRWVQGTNCITFQDRAVQPQGYVDWAKNFMTGYGIG